jgi:hypothetical protein
MWSWPKLKYYPNIRLDTLKKLTIVDVLAEIRNGHISHTSHKRYRLS